jgi:hypothetical protein
MAPTTPRARRSVAQLLALAIALDPANDKARQLVTEYQNDQHKPVADGGALASQLMQIISYVKWLQTPAAGSHGQALAACLKDILSLADPQQNVTNEAGAWTGWVPDLAAYSDKIEESKPKTPEESASTQTTLPLSSAEVHTLLWQKTGSDMSAHWVLASAPLQMSASRTSNDILMRPRPLTIAIGSGLDGGLFTQLNGMLLKLLNANNDKLPAGYRISITSPALEQAVLSKKNLTISAAAAVLASAAVTGREPDAIILGQIDETGAYKLPTGFWNQLQALGKGNGQRLVLPAKAASFLPALLALEKPGFFLEYEVLLAADFKGLLDLSAKQPDEALTTSTAKFREVRDRAGTQDVRQYIANRFVRQRLSDILQEAPYHESAKMLLIQAAGKRPIVVARSVLAAELLRAIEPMDWIVCAPDSTRLENKPLPRNLYGSEFTAAEIAKFAPTIELCRSRVEELDHHADKNERDLIEQTRKVVTAIRTLDRAARARGDYVVIQKTLHSAFDDLTNCRTELGEKLDREAGE